MCVCESDDDISLLYLNPLLDGIPSTLRAVVVHARMQIVCVCLCVYVCACLCVCVCVSVFVCVCVCAQQGWQAAALLCFGIDIVITACQHCGAVRWLEAAKRA